MEEKHLFIFVCKKCKKGKRESISKEKAEEGLCRKCRAFKEDPNQLKIA